MSGQYESMGWLQGDAPTAALAWQNQQSSVLFRRGANMASPDKAFSDIELGLQIASEGKDHVEVLVVGVAQGQEPLSTLVVLDHLARQKGKRLGDFVGLNLLDARPKLEADQVISTIHGHLVDYALPHDTIVGQGLELSDENGKLQVKPHIVDFFMGIVGDPLRSHWETSAQDHFESDDGKRYDAILYNNVDGHIVSFLDREVILRGALIGLANRGVLITDHNYGAGRTLANMHDFASLRQTYQLEEVAPGVFKRG